MAKQEQMLSGTGHGDIEFPVDQLSLFLKDVVCQEIQLIPLLDGKAIQDVITLASLVTLHRVYGDLAQWRQGIAFEEMTDGSDLVAVGNNHTYGLCRIKMRWIHSVDLSDCGGDHFRFNAIYLVGWALLWKGNLYEGHSMGSEQLLLPVYIV